MAEKKQIWKPGNMLYPLPAVLVSLRDGEGRDNILTVAWTGTVCTNPAMLYISVTTEELAWATDYCGVTSGRDVDKFAACHLTREEAFHIDAPMIAESPVNIECRVTQVLELGSHHMFLAKVEAVHVSEKYMDETGRFALEKAKPITYSHGTYYMLGRKLGTFGYSVKKRKKR